MSSKKKTKKKKEKERSAITEPLNSVTANGDEDWREEDMWHDFCAKKAIPVEALTRLLLIGAAMIAIWLIASWLDPIDLEDAIDFGEKGRILWTYPGVQAEDFLWAGLALLFGLNASMTVFGKNSDITHIKTTAFCGAIAFSLKSLPSEGTAYNYLGIDWMDSLYCYADVVCVILLCFLVAACVGSSLSESQRVAGASQTIAIAVGVIAAFLMFVMCLDAGAFALFLLYVTFAVIAYLLARPHEL